jgi:lysophospholipase L1-like esterase
MRFRDGSVPLPARGAFRRNLVSIVGLAKAHGIRPVLLTQPATFTEDKMALMFGHKEYNDVAVYPRPEEFRRLFEEYNSVIAEVARHEAVALVDMYRLMGHDEVYFRDMVHMTPAGVRRFGRIYADALRPMVGEQRGH